MKSNKFSILFFNITLLILVLLNSNICAQNENSDSTEYYTTEVKLNGRYLKNYWTDTKGIFTEPLHWDKKDWGIFTLYTGAAVGVYFGLDQNIHNWSQENRMPITNEISATFEKIGFGNTPAIGLALYYIYGSIAKKEKAKRVSLIAYEAFALTGLYVTIVKYASGRLRPYTGANYNEWYGPHLKGSAYKSFYSGHTGAIFSVATVVAMEYRDIKIVPPICYTLATLAAFSRVHDDAHWASDIFVSAVLAHYMTKFIVNQYKKRRDNIIVYPVLSSNLSGVTIRMNF